jgi:hypothetical protein
MTAVNFPDFFEFDFFLAGFLLLSPTVRSGLAAADGRADVHQSAASSHQA